MVYKFKFEKVKPSLTRKMPYLPRVGFMLDIGGRQLSFRQVPLTETIVNLLERGVSLANFESIVAEQIGEMKFPFKKNRKTVNVKARTISKKSRKI